MDTILPSTPTTSPARSDDTPRKTPTSRYSARLKAACAEGAEARRPPCPAHCCFCGHPRVFTQITYKVTNAGKWCAVCPSCSRTWFPEQASPPPAQLERIEAIRAEDKETARDFRVAVAAERAWTKEITAALRVKGNGGRKKKGIGKGNQAADSVGGEPNGSSQGSTLDGSAPSDVQEIARDVTGSGPGAGGGADPFAEGQKDSEQMSVTPFDPKVPRKRVRLVLWAKSNSQPLVFTVNADRGIFFLGFKLEVLNHAQITFKDRWDRWRRDTCNWDTNICVGAMLQLEADEHLVIGRLRGVIRCKGLGLAIEAATQRTRSIAWGMHADHKVGVQEEDSDGCVVLKKRKRRINALAGPSNHPTALQETLANAQAMKVKEARARAKGRGDGTVGVIDLTREDSPSTIDISD